MKANHLSFIPKSISRRLFVGLLAFSPKILAAPPTEKVILSGDVVRIIEHGLIASVAFEDNGETWRGVIFLFGHPKQKTLAEGDHINLSTCERIGNYRDGGSVIRAYKYLSSRWE